MNLIKIVIVIIFITINFPSFAEHAAVEKECEALFVQNARSVSVDKNTFTLKGVGPTVIYFCDRPVRMAGHLSLKEFMDSWTQDNDNFSDNPPNAVLSVIDGDEMLDVVVELTQQPKLNGDELTYTFNVIDGEGPKAGGASSLFIDVIGRPATPMSVAGVHRRHVRRAVRRCAAGVTCY